MPQSTDTPETLISYLSDMHLIRCFEQKTEELFSEGRIAGTAHPATGQEATAVGVCAALTDKDAITSTHRGHGHFLARGGDPNRIMAELFGRVDGYSGGRGGSQMMADYQSGFMGANGITGGSLPTAVGLALNARLTGSARVTVCFFGDGASNQGTFHESLNLAALWKLPVLFICENNGYAMSTPIKSGLSQTSIASRANAYNIPGHSVDGNDILAVRDITRKAHSLAMNGGGPSLIVCNTYRLSGHSRGDQRVYRSREEEDNAWRIEPISRFEKYLENKHIITGTEALQLRNNAETLVADAILFSEASPRPEAGTALSGVFA